MPPQFFLSILKLEHPSHSAFQPQRCWQGEHSVWRIICQFWKLKRKGKFRTQLKIKVHTSNLDSRNQQAKWSFQTHKSFEASPPGEFWGFYVCGWMCNIAKLVELRFNIMSAIKQFSCCTFRLVLVLCVLCSQCSSTPSCELCEWVSWLLTSAGGWITNN